MSLLAINILKDMQTFSVILNQGSLQRELSKESYSYICEVIAIQTDNPLKNSTTISSKDVLYCPETKSRWEILLIK